MAITLKIEGRANGGYKMTYQNVVYEVRNLRYIGYPGAVTVWADELWGNKKVLIFPAINIPVSEIQVGATSGYATSEEVSNALDTLIDTVTKQSEQTTLLESIAGQSFLVISDTSTHADIDCTSIEIMEDAVFNEILVGGANVVAARGLTGITVPAGMLLPFGKAHATSVKLTSGKVIAYIN